jgi:hypothetical protein
LSGSTTTISAVGVLLFTAQKTFFVPASAAMLVSVPAESQRVTRLFQAENTVEPFKIEPR